jgi:hypothetical protein
MLKFLDDVVHVPVPEDRPRSHGHVADELIDGETYEFVTCTVVALISSIPRRAGF